eukprot:1158390-Pelagomonas_calceolata.AAC.5
MFKVCPIAFPFISHSCSRKEKPRVAKCSEPGLNNQLTQKRGAAGRQAKLRKVSTLSCTTPYPDNEQASY